MYLEDIKLSEHVVETADAVVAIDANDLPAPGDGFATFFQRLTQSGRATGSREAFDARVVRAYSHRPNG